MCLGADADKKNGILVLTVVFAIYTYATAWLIVTPFVEEDYEVYISNYFPPREYALAFLVMFGVVWLALIGSVLGVLMINPRAKSSTNK